jgi:TRAP transporter TAXI family solute receptor
VSVIALALVAVTILGAAARSDAARETWPKSASVGTAPIGGTYYIWGGAFSRIVQDKLGVPTTVEVTQGPVPNIKLVDAGQQTFGIASNGIVYDGVRGLGWSQGKKHEHIRVILPMYAAHLHCVALTQHGVRSVRDLDGKPVGAGAKGGTPDLYFRRVIEILGLKPSRIINLGFEDMNNQTRDGVIVGYCTNVGPPQASIVELETTHPVVIFGVEPEDARKVQAKFPYMLPGTLGAGTYKTQKEPIPTIVDFNLLVGHKDLPEDFVYELIRAVYADQDRLIAAHPVGKELPPDRANQSAAPLHPGAIRYFTEKGVKLSPEVYPPESRR